jgi:hypothetical protein
MSKEQGGSQLGFTCSHYILKNYLSLKCDALQITIMPLV